MQDLLNSIQVFLKQQDTQEIQVGTTELNQLLEESLKLAQQGELISNEEVLKEGKEWLNWF